MYIYIYVYMYVYVCIYVYVCMHICVWEFLLIWVCAHFYMYNIIIMCKFVCMHILHILVCVCVYECALSFENRFTNSVTVYYTDLILLICSFLSFFFLFCFLFFFFSFFWGRGGKGSIDCLFTSSYFFLSVYHFCISDSTLNNVIKVTPLMTLCCLSFLVLLLSLL